MKSPRCLFSNASTRALAPIVRYCSGHHAYSRNPRKHTREQFELDLQKKWLVERNIEIISEASRDHPETMKLRHGHIPWRKVAGIGNVIRRAYERIESDVLRKLVRDDLPVLEAACRNELAATLADETE